MEHKLTKSKGDFVTFTGKGFVNVFFGVAPVLLHVLMSKAPGPGVKFSVKANVS